MQSNCAILLSAVTCNACMHRLRIVAFSKINFRHVLLRNADISLLWNTFYFFLKMFKKILFFLFLSLREIRFKFLSELILLLRKMWFGRSKFTVVRHFRQFHEWKTGTFLLSLYALFNCRIECWRHRQHVIELITERPCNR